MYLHAFKSQDIEQFFEKVHEKKKEIVLESRFGWFIMGLLGSLGQNYMMFQFGGSTLSTILILCLNLCIFVMTNHNTHILIDKEQMLQELMINGYVPILNNIPIHQMQYGLKTSITNLKSTMLNDSIQNSIDQEKNDHQALFANFSVGSGLSNLEEDKQKEINAKMANFYGSLVTNKYLEGTIKILTSSAIETHKKTYNVMSLMQNEWKVYRSLMRANNLHYSGLYIHPEEQRKIMFTVRNILQSLLSKGKPYNHVCIVGSKKYRNYIYSLMVKYGQIYGIEFFDTDQGDDFYNIMNELSDISNSNYNSYLIQKVENKVVQYIYDMVHSTIEQNKTLFSFESKNKIRACNSIEILKGRYTTGSLQDTLMSKQFMEKLPFVMKGKQTNTLIVAYSRSKIQMDKAIQSRFGYILVEEDKYSREELIRRIKYFTLMIIRSSTKHFHICKSVNLPKIHTRVFKKIIRSGDRSDGHIFTALNRELFSTLGTSA